MAGKILGKSLPGFAVVSAEDEANELSAYLFARMPPDRIEHKFRKDYVAPMISSDVEICEEDGSYRILVTATYKGRNGKGKPEVHEEPVRAKDSKTAEAVAKEVQNLLLKQYGLRRVDFLPNHSESQAGMNSCVQRGFAEIVQILPTDKPLDTGGHYAGFGLKKGSISVEPKGDIYRFAIEGTYRNEHQETLKVKDAFEVGSLADATKIANAAGKYYKNRGINRVKVKLPNRGVV